MKPLSEFGPDKRNKTHGRRPSCRDCFRNYGREYHRRTKHIHHYLKRIRKNYGISREVYFAALDRCGGLCECCGQPQSWKRLAVDHCHQTGTFRGLLCNSCNLALGDVNDDPRLAEQLWISLKRRVTQAEQLLIYLRKHATV